MLRPDIPDPLKSVLRKLSLFFNGQQQWKEILVFLFFILLSAAFWYLQSLQQEQEMEISVPVKYKNIPEEIVLSADNPQAITARVRDRGTVLINYVRLYPFDPIEVNVKERLKNDRQITVTAKVIESGISKQLISSTTLLSIEPQQIRVEYAELQTKELPVSANVSLSPESGYQLSGPITVAPATVRVYATAAMPANLSEVKTEPVVLKKANKTKEITVSLQKIAGVRTVPDEVTVTIPIEEFTEKRLTLPVQCQQLPENCTLHTFPASVEVICNVPVSRFKSLSDADFEIRIPFREFEAAQASGKITVRLTEHPPGISPPKINPDLVEFIIERNDP